MAQAKQLKEQIVGPTLDNPRNKRAWREAAFLLTFIHFKAAASTARLTPFRAPKVQRWFSTFVQPLIGPTVIYLSCQDRKQPRALQAIPTNLPPRLRDFPPYITLIASANPTGTRNVFPCTVGVMWLNNEIN